LRIRQAARQAGQLPDPVSVRPVAKVDFPLTRPRPAPKLARPDATVT
jgi:hypothetical protein